MRLRAALHRQCGTPCRNSIRKKGEDRQSRWLTHTRSCASAVAALLRSLLRGQSDGCRGCKSGALRQLQDVGVCGHVVCGCMRSMGGLSSASSNSNLQVVGSHPAAGMGCGVFCMKCLHVCIECVGEALPVEHD